MSTTARAARVGEWRDLAHWSGSTRSGNELFPAEQARLIQLLIERVDVAPDGLTIRLRTEGFVPPAADLQQKAAA